MFVSVVVGSLFVLASLPGESAYLKGCDAYRAGEFVKAAKSFQESASDPAYAPWALVRVAMCLAGQNNVAAAESTFRQVLEGPDGPWKAMARGHWATLSAARKDYRAVVTNLEGFERITPTPWWMDTYLSSFSTSALAGGGDQESGLVILRDTIDNTNYIQQRLDASRSLFRTQSPRDQSIALLGLLRANAYTDLKQRVPELTATLPPEGTAGVRVADLVALLSDSDAGNDTAALDLIAQNASEPAAQFALAYATRMQAQRSDLVRAEVMCNALIAVAPDSREAGDTIWYLGTVLEKAGKLVEADRVYDLLPTRCKTHFRADDALYQLGEMHFRTGNKAKGMEYFVRLGREFPDSRYRSQAYYKCASQPTVDPELKRLYLTAAATDGLGYFYAHRALSRLHEADGDAKKNFVNLRVDGANPVLLPFGDCMESLPPLPESVTSDIAYRRLAFFGRNGLEEGEWEVMPLLQAMSSSPDQEARYRAISEAGLAHTALQFAVHQQWGVDDKGKRSLARLRLEYPRAYWEEACEMGRATGLDPYFILSIARQESTFRPNLTSRSGASGVMQLMPKTAKWLAEVDPNIEKLHVTNLESPVNSLRLGAWYLHRMVERSNGNLIDAAASYNGGPGNRDKWRAQFPNYDLDAFVEAIPFDETRDYVQRVLGNYAAYRSLYEPAP